MDVYMSSLEEYLFDEGRTVTYKWLSCTLDVHVNVAKQMLWHFLESKGEGLTAVFLLAGEREEPATRTTSLVVKLVRQTGLEEAKKSLKTVVGLHVYSLSKSAVKDSSSLLLANRESASFSSRANSAVVSDSLRVLSEEEALARRNSVSAQLQSVPKSSTGAAKVAKKLEKNEEKKPDVNGAGSGPKGKAPAGVAAMFGNAKVKQKTASRPVKASDEVVEIKKEDPSDDSKPVAVAVAKASAKAKSAAKTSSIGSMFAKQAGKVKKEKEEPKKETTTTEPTNKPTIKEEAKDSPTEREKSLKDSVAGDTKPISKPEEKKEKTPKVQIEKSEKRKHNAAEDDSDAGKKVKRRRVRQMSDSSDEETPMEAEEVEEEEKEVEKKENEDPSSKSTGSQKRPLLSDDDDVIPATPPPAATSAGKKKLIKIRRLKDKTYVDEEGNFVTEKVMGSEEEEEEEEEENSRLGQVKQMFQEKKDRAEKAAREREDREREMTAMEDEGEEKKKKKSVAAKKKNSPAFGKQMTISTFFKKK